MPHDHAYRCPVCGRGYERKGRWGICNGKPRHQFDIITLEPKRGRAKNRRKEKR